MSLDGPRDQIIAICRLAWQRGYMAATDGNLSMRLGPNRVLITPSGRSKALVQASDLVQVDMQGRAVEPGDKPSAELKLHLMVYEELPDAQAVIHAHPPLSTAYAATGREPDLASLPEALASLGRARLVPYASPGALGGDELARAARPLLSGAGALLLAHHGALTWGADLEQAFARTEKLENAAQVLLAAQTLGGARPLPRAEQARLLALGGWGQKPPASPPPLAQRIELKQLKLSDEFLTEKRYNDARGQAHLIVDGRAMARVAYLTLMAGAGYRGGHIHAHKNEGFYVVSGRARVGLICRETGERLDLDLEPGARLWLPPGVAHRISASEDLAFVEFTDRAYDPNDDTPFDFPDHA